MGSGRRAGGYVDEVALVSMVVVEGDFDTSIAVSGVSVNDGGKYGEQ